MECDAQRAGVGPGVGELLCPTRRGIIGGLATLVAVGSLSQRAPLRGQYDATLKYFHGEFMDAASRLQRVDGDAQDALYRRMVALATALSLVPAVTPRAWLLKQEIADWSFQEGRYTLRLPSDLVAVLCPENSP